MYHIFTARKLILTHKINTIGLQLMQAQFKRDEVGDNLMDAYATYYGVDTKTDSTNGSLTFNQTRQMAGVQQNTDTEESDKNMQYEIMKAKQEEDQLDAYIKRLETELTAAQQELQSVEKQEGEAIKRSIPNYSGVGGN